MPAESMSCVRAAGAPVQLQVMMEGESLFNDATAIVLFQGSPAVLVACHTYKDRASWTLSMA